jgi:hypothetical protein
LIVVLLFGLQIIWSINGYYFFVFNLKKFNSIFSRFSISTFAYSVVLIFFIWNIALLKLDVYPDNKCEIDDGYNETLSRVDLLKTPFWLLVNKISYYHILKFKIILFEF